MTITIFLLSFCNFTTKKKTLKCEYELCKVKLNFMSMKYCTLNKITSLPLVFIERQVPNVENTLCHWHHVFNSNIHNYINTNVQMTRG